MQNKTALHRLWATLLLGLSLLLAGCEDVDIMLAADAGVDAARAATLSEEAVRELSGQSAQYADAKHRVAPATNAYAQRLARLSAGHLEQGGYRFNCKVYLVPEVNAFAMADGTIRIYSGLMDMMNDDELFFVLGHEMGHVVEKHVLKKMRISYAASALRKGVASLNSNVGAMAGSALGGFVERLLNARFSQHEEQMADDFGLSFLEKTGADPAAAVSALRKLAALGGSHSFLSSHPAPDRRAGRLTARLSPTPKQNQAGKTGTTAKL